MSHHNKQEYLISFLQNIPYLMQLPLSLIHEIAEDFEMIYVLSGETLLKQGDVGDCLYIVEAGRFIAQKIGSNGKPAVIGDIRRGELIGELAVFTEAPRYATVIAVRDSLLWKLSKQAFEQFVIKYPAHVLPMVKTAMLRLLNPIPKKAIEFKCITIMPAGPHPLNASCVRDLISELQTKKTTLHLNQKFVKEQLTSIDIENFDKSTELANWLCVQESKFSYVIYENDGTSSSWTKLCLRHADKVVLIADYESPNDLNGGEEILFEQNKSLRVPVFLTLVYKTDQRLASHAKYWLKNRSVEIFNIRKNNSKDIQRLARLVTGNEVALVLGGGGVKSLAHLGVYKALRELDIPIDRICGTSGGGFIGGYLAMERSIDEFIALYESALSQGTHDYTLPVIALMKGGRWLQVIKDFFGTELHIEDLWKNFFCIASNLTCHKMEVLNQGFLYKAIRATVSLPGILPPISNEKNELYVDGGVMNNLPVDVMRGLSPNANIFAIQVSPSSMRHGHIPDGVASGFELFYNHVKRKNLVSCSLIPNIMEVITESIILENEKNEKKMFKLANHSIVLDLQEFDLLDFEKYKQLIDMGYKEAMDYFSNQTFNMY